MPDPTPRPSPADLHSALRALLVGALLGSPLAVGCSGNGPAGTPDAAADAPADGDAGSESDGADANADSDGPDADTDDDSDPDTDADAEPDSDDARDADADDTDAEDADDADTRPSGWPETPQLRRYIERPERSVLPAELESCAVIGEERCVDGTSQRCELYDATSNDWAEDVPRMTLQAFWFDRYYDLYHDFEGMAVDVDFVRPLPEGLSEAEWSDPDNFERMNAYGDASGWSGTALFGSAARYQVTGTEADYERMLARFESFMMFYEVTNIPGMIARSHFGLLPPDAPRPHGLWGLALSPWFSDDGTGWHYHYAIESPVLERMPDYYDAGVTIDGTHYDTEPRWQGDASRDMYVRSLPGALLAYDLLGEGEREDRLREVMRAELPCTLNRMKYYRIENLQARPDLIDAISAFLGSGTLNNDPEDLDFGELDTLVLFAMEQPNPARWDLFDRSCPDGPPLEPALVLDAGAPTFVLDMLELFRRNDRASIRPIAWFQAPSVRAADLLYMLQWALVAHYLTEDARYLEFVDLLTRETEFAGVLRTYGSFTLPKWCQSHYAPSLSYPTLYNLAARIDRDAYPTTAALLSEVARTEARGKEMAGRGDSYFGVLYNRMVTPEYDPTMPEYVEEHIALLRGYGNDPDNPLEPDRNRNLDWVDPPVEGLELEYPTDEVRAICEAPIRVLGLEFDAPGMNDEGPRAVHYLPLHMRDNGGFTWTADPWLVQRNRGQGTMQFPMLGMTVPYWIGRSDRVITEGSNLALAWHEHETCTD